ncbi:MAG: hypothetical protein ACTSO9_20315 [Candidatus Helarchaeota archaeon]
MLKKSSHFNLYYRYLPRDTRILEKINLYDGLMIGGPLGCWLKPRITNYLKKIKKPFFIDPQTYIFQSKLKETRPHLIFSRLCGKIFQDLFNNKKKLEISQFKKNSNWNNSFIKNFSDKLLQFELNYLKEKNIPINKYFRLLGKQPKSDINAKPEFLIPPYFYFDEIGNDWYELCLLMSNYAKKNYKKEIYPVLCFSIDELKDLNRLKKMLSDHKKFDGFLLFIPNFDAYYITIISEYLENLIYLIKNLSKDAKKTILLFGGPLFFYLEKIGLNGIVSGIYYGQRRYISYREVRGGGKRYYIQKLKRNFSMAKSITYTTISPTLKCDCLICKNKNINELSFREKGIHFLISRQKQKIEIENESIANLIQKEKKIYNELDDIIKINTRYFPEWMKIIKTYIL